MKKPPNWLLTLFSIVIGLIAWYLLSAIPAVGTIITNPVKVFTTFQTEIMSGRLWINVWASLLRVVGGFSLGLIVAIPVAFLMAWYPMVRSIVDPWIQFFRTIPPIALIPLVIISQGVGESAKITVIFVATFLVMVITIFQGVRNVDPTLIRAARVLGAKDRDIFFEVIVPASFPFILVGVRLGLAAAWTTLVAAELTGANKGLGNMIMEASLYFRMDTVILGIIVIGVIGLAMDRFVLFLERRLTGWQELRQE
ncbi:ABC transporter permease [Paenibacillus antarcticus]|nr:ABC transporter permease [Paenibacillus antarcticus]